MLDFSGTVSLSGNAIAFAASENNSASPTRTAAAGALVIVRILAVVTARPRCAPVHPDSARREERPPQIIDQVTDAPAG